MRRQIALANDQSWTGHTTGPVRDGKVEIELDHGGGGVVPVSQLVFLDEETKQWPPSSLETKGL